MRIVRNPDPRSTNVFESDNEFTDYRNDPSQPKVSTESDVFTIEIFDNASEQEITAMEYAHDYYDIDDAVDAAKEAYEKYKDDGEDIEVRVFGGEYERTDRYGSGIYGEPDVWFTVKDGGKLYDAAGKEVTEDGINGTEEPHAEWNDDGEPPDAFQLAGQMKNESAKRDIASEISQYIHGQLPAFDCSDELGEEYECVYFEYDRNRNTLKFGTGVCNAGLLPDGEMDYDENESVQSNLEALHEYMIDFYQNN